VVIKLTNTGGKAIIDTQPVMVVLVDYEVITGLNVALFPRVLVA
jgi:hypothetical protein